MGNFSEVASFSKLLRIFYDYTTDSKLQNEIKPAL